MIGDRMRPAIRPRTMPTAVRRAPAARPAGPWTLSGVCFVLFVTIALIGSNLLQFGGTTDFVEGQGDTLNQVAYIGIFVSLLLAGGMRDTRTLLCVPFGITVLIGYCFLSVLWALAPFISFRRIAQTAIVMWILFRIVDDLGSDRVLRLLRQLLVALLIANFAAVLLTPNGVHLDVLIEEPTVVGSWRGLISHKNIAGAVCAMTILLFLFDNRDFPRIASVAVVVAAGIFLYFTHSKTSQAMVVIAVFVGMIIRPYNANHRAFFAVLLLFGLVVAVQLLSYRSAELSDLLNDPTALTGRGAIWPLLLEYAADHPWTGAGFGSFWQIGDDGPIWTLTSGWVAVYGAHGHNGYLDLLVTIGIPGLILAIATLILWPLARLLFSLSIAKPRRSLLLAMMTFCVGNNLTESTLLGTATAVQIFLTITIAIIYRESRSSAGIHQALRRRMLRWSGAYRQAKR